MGEDSRKANDQAQRSTANPIRQAELAPKAAPGEEQAHRSEATPAVGSRLSGAEVEAEVGHAPSESPQREGQPRNPVQPAGAESPAMRVQHSGDAAKEQGTDANRGEETRAAVESVIAQNPG